MLLTAYVAQISDQPQTLTLSMSQGDASGFAVVTSGGKVQPLSGKVTLTVAPGEDSVGFTLLNNIAA